MKLKINVLIIGAGVAGKELLREIRKNLKDTHEVKGFVDDDKAKIGKTILSTKVLGGIDDLPKLINDKKISVVYVAIPSARGEQMRRIFNICKNEKVVVKVIPRTIDIIEGKVGMSDVRDVQIEDLLGRDIIKAELNNIKREFKDKTILVTGAAGSIGSEIVRQLLWLNPKKVVGIDRWENGLHQLNIELQTYLLSGKYAGVICDIKDKNALEDVFRKVKPQYVFHAAAYKHVPLMQQYPKEAIKNNVFGTLNVALSAKRNGVKKFINISTDKAVNPTTIMGTTKLISENILRSLNDSDGAMFISVRFGNVLGSDGSVVPLFKKQIARGGPITVTDKRMVRYFMTIPEAVMLVLNAAFLGVGGETFILDMGEQISILSLAETMIRLSGYIPHEEIKIVFTGKRSGEKMKEALVTENEQLVKTENSKIFKLAKYEKKIDNVRKYLDILENIIQSSPDSKVVNVLSEVSPKAKFYKYDSFI